MAAGAVGTNVKFGVGTCVGGRMTPAGARRISTDSGATVPKFVLVGTAMIWTHVPGKPLHVPKTPLLGAGGAYARLYAAQFAQALAEVD